MKVKDTTLKNNLSALEKVYEKLGQQVREAKPLDWIQVTNSDNNMPNLLIKVGAKNLPAYNMDNPRKEANEAIKEIQFNNEDLTVVLGSGLGYLTKAILDKAEKGHNTIILDPCFYMLKVFLSHYNFEKELLSGRLIICPSKEDFSYIMGVIETKKVVSNHQIIGERYTMLRIGEYKEVKDFVTNTINQIRSNVGTVISNGAIIAQNDISGLPYYIRHRGVVDLKDIFKDKPCVSVGTGPSLQKNIHWLKEHQDKVIIVSVAQALRILLAYDIRPDFITSVDFGETNMGHYKGLMSSDVPLVILNRAYYPILKKYQGPKFIMASGCGGEESSIFRMIDEKGYLPAGGSVIHSSLSLSILLGCNTVIFIGHDLSLPGGKSHFNQADESGEVKVNEQGIIEWQIKDHRSHLQKSNNGMFSMGTGVYLPGYYGGTVLTNTGLLSFHTAIENMINEFSKEREVKFINATEGGCRFKGADLLSLKEALDKYAIETIDKSVITPLLTLDPKADELINKAIPILKNDIRSFNKIYSFATRALRTTDRIEKTKDKKEMGKLLDLNRELSVVAENESNKNPLMGLTIYKESFEIHTREFKAKKTGTTHFLKEEGKEDLKTAVKKNKYILEAAKRAALSLKKLYQETLKTLENFKETEDECLLLDTRPEEIDLSDSEEYFERGNFAHPLLDTRRFLYGKFIPEPLDLPCREGVSNSKEFGERIKALQIKQKALAMREEAINEAKKIEVIDQAKTIRFNYLIEESKKIGQSEIKKWEEDNSYAPSLDQTLPLVEEAVSIFPDREEPLWGLATSLNFCKKYKESLEKYEKLVNDFPNSFYLNKYKSEMTLVMLKTDRANEGLQLLEELVEKDPSLVHFCKYLGSIYQETYYSLNKNKDVIKKAIKYYTKYLDIFSQDYNILREKGKCLKEIGEVKKADRYFQKANKIKPVEKENK